jgi:hypothetical protein
MFARTFKIAALVALSAATIVPAAAEARHYRGDGYNNGGYGRGYGRGYRDGPRYYEGRGGYGGRDYYRGGRGRCRDKGTGGTIIGAIAGGLLGHEVGQGRYNRGDGTAGAIVGAGVGALAGRAIDRDC